MAVSSKSAFRLSVWAWLIGLVLVSFGLVIGYPTGTAIDYVLFGAVVVSILIGGVGVVLGWLSMAQSSN